MSSTNIEARNLFQQGETEGLIVAAKTQTAGRGRKDRSWLSPIGGLYFSIVLKPRLGAANAPLLGFLSSCAVARSLVTIGIENVKLKWPNDVMIEGKKVAGILSEAVSIDGGFTGVIIGIGVNQNFPISGLPSDMHSLATSIIDEIGKETSSESLLCSIVNEIDKLLQTVENEFSFTTVLDEWRKMSSTLGAKVRIHEEGKTIDGIARDIGKDGALLVETTEGFRNVVEGDVSHLRTSE